MEVVPSVLKRRPTNRDAGLCGPNGFPNCCSVSCACGVRCAGLQERKRGGSSTPRQYQRAILQQEADLKEEGSSAASKYTVDCVAHNSSQAPHAPFGYSRQKLNTGFLCDLGGLAGDFFKIEKQFVFRATSLLWKRHAKHQRTFSIANTRGVEAQGSAQKRRWG